jgi:hypothetical protein
MGSAEEMHQSLLHIFLGGEKLHIHVQSTAARALTMRDRDSTLIIFPCGGRVSQVETQVREELTEICHVFGRLATCHAFGLSR